MAKEIDKIIKSTTPPKSKDVLWDNGKELLINRNGKWESTGGSTPMINITYANLVELRNNNKLIAGMQYRITDYVTTTAQENTRSAGHQFDVIVTADSENTLNEVARACLHEGDTYFSEAGANLAAWQIWYSLDNDAERFAWADSENGKGVIYRMIDEWNNDIPYDFKNILFMDMDKYKISAEANYYSNWWAGELVRYSLLDVQTVGPPYYAWILTNVTGPGSSGVWYTNNYNVPSEDTIFYEYNGSEFYVSETIRITDIALGAVQYTFGNVLSPDNAVSEFVDYTMTTPTSDDLCNNNIIKAVITDKQELNFILFGSFSKYNTFGSDCYNNIFGNNCQNNSFGNRCQNNSFGNNCYDNTFSDDCCHNHFVEKCTDNIFCNGCSNISFGIECLYNSFAALCQNVKLSNNTYYKTVSVNSNNEVKIFNLADLADLLNQ